MAAAMRSDYKMARRPGHCVTKRRQSFAVYDNVAGVKIMPTPVQEDIRKKAEKRSGTDCAAAHETGDIAGYERILAVPRKDFAVVCDSDIYLQAVALHWLVSAAKQSKCALFATAAGLKSAAKLRPLNGFRASIIGGGIYGFGHLLADAIEYCLRGGWIRFRAQERRGRNESSK